MIDGTRIVGLSNWKWAHEGTFDYPTEDLLPRGPMPAKWMQYHGHYLFENQVVLSYSIDGRKILEMPSKPKGFGAIVQTLQIEAGNEDLLLQVAKLEKDNVVQGYLPLLAKEAKLDPASGIGIAVNMVKEDGAIGRFTAVFAKGGSDESLLKPGKENATT